MEFACSPERLWPFLEEPEKQKLWMKGLLEKRSTSQGPTREGSTFLMKIKEGKRVLEYEGVITACERPRRLGVRFWGGALKPGMAMRADYRLTELTGRTRLDYACSLEAEKLGFFMRLMMPVVLVFGRLQVRRFFRALRRLTEETV